MLINLVKLVEQSIDYNSNQEDQDVRETHPQEEIQRGTFFFIRSSKHGYKFFCDAMTVPISKSNSEKK